MWDKTEMDSARARVHRCLVELEHTEEALKTLLKFVNELEALQRAVSVSKSDGAEEMKQTCIRICQRYVSDIGNASDNGEMDISLTREKQALVVDIMHDIASIK
jgi:hypothetical protein